VIIIVKSTFLAKTAGSIVTGLVDRQIVVD
jgi:hypothetical protein